MPKPIQNATEDEPSAVPLRTGGRLARQYEYLVFYFFAIASWSMEIACACLGSLYGAQSHYFIATVSPFLSCWAAAFLQTCWMMATAPRRSIADRMAYLNLACRFQRLCAPTALIGMVTWAVGYRFRDKASSSGYWIIFLVVWISNTVFCMMNVYNNISWESDLLYQIAPEYPQGNFWLAVLGIRSMCTAKHKHHRSKLELEEVELEEQHERQRRRDQFRRQHEGTHLSKAAGETAGAKTGTKHGTGSGAGTTGANSNKNTLHISAPSTAPTEENTTANATGSKTGTPASGRRHY